MKSPFQNQMFLFDFNVLQFYHLYIFQMDTKYFLTDLKQYHVSFLNALSKLPCFISSELNLIFDLKIIYFGY